MAATYTGSCSCGAIQIELQGEPSVQVSSPSAPAPAPPPRALDPNPALHPLQALCHCRDCHKSTGSTYSTNFIWPQSAFKLVAGEPTVYEKVGGSGHPVRKLFCGTCGCQMWTRPSARPEIVVVKAGVLEGGALAKRAPAAEMFTSRKPGWVASVEGAAQFAETYSAH
ncbi:hypothetical protein MMC18_001556 [Xylographa bjoerkii]|nr:hypothetical protein [Xylographa bjoerkii]